MVIYAICNSGSTSVPTQPDGVTLLAIQDGGTGRRLILSEEVLGVHGTSSLRTWENSNIQPWASVTWALRRGSRQHRRRS